MSVCLSVCLVFGYHFPNNELGLECDDFSEVTVDPVDCMNSKGNSGVLVYATDSRMKLLGDRDGYEYDNGVVSFAELPIAEEWEELLRAFFEKFPADRRPKTIPGWHIHIDVG